MKKIYSSILILLLALGFQSCEPDAAATQASSGNKHLLKKIVTTLSSGGSYEQIYLYTPANKLTRINNYSNGNLDSYSEYQYNSSGNIFKINQYYGSSLMSISEYIYDASGKVTMQKIYDASNVLTAEVTNTYNTDNSINKTLYHYINPANSDLAYDYVYNAAGKLTHYLQSSNRTGSWQNEGRTNIISYDTKNTPFRDTFENNTAFTGFSVHNLTAWNTLDAAGVQTGNNIVNYTYNSFNFPITGHFEYSFPTNPTVIYDLTYEYYVL
jgi:hypothetical protein